MTELIGHMYLARRPCGKVVACCWDDDNAKQDTAKHVARWVKRGESVERIARYEGDPQPEWCCAPNEPCVCRRAAAMTGEGGKA